jgi:prepilin-type N-terminal cleavage/methylation domain-containing protein
MRLDSSQIHSGQVHSSLRRDLGFSLLEVMVAISVLSIVVLGVSLIPALGLGRNNDTRTYAVNVAREVLDSYRSLWQERTQFQGATDPPGYRFPKALRFDCVLNAPVVEHLKIDTSPKPPGQPSFALIPTVGSETPMVQKISVTITCPKAGKTSFSTYIGDPSPAGS